MANKSSNNPHLQMLCLVKVLSTFDALQASALCQMFDISSATLKRYIAEARHLGCQIVSAKSGALSVYELRNAAAVVPTLEKWIAVESARSVAGALCDQ